MKNEEILFKIQALVDNELPEEEIPTIIETIQANYEYRNEYADLLQLKRHLAGVNFPNLPHDWYAQFVEKPSKRLFLTLGSVFALISFGVFLIFQTAVGLELISHIPAWGQGIWIVSGLLGVIHFLIHAFQQKSAENKGKSYKEIIR
jgi:hypothetical protein